MRYQLRHYVNGVPYAVKGRIIDVDTRETAVKVARDIYGVASGGAVALDVDCTYCEDCPVENAERWLDANAKKTAACPQCGRTPDQLSQEVAS